MSQFLCFGVTGSSTDTCEDNNQTNKYFMSLKTFQ